jgi:hypothetical protein
MAADHTFPRQNLWRVARPANFISMLADRERRQHACETLRLVLTNHFGLIRMKKFRQSNPSQITDELVYVLRTVNDAASHPRQTLADLGIVVFPGALAFCLSSISRLFGITKSSFSAKLKAANWATEVFCPSRVKEELRKIVGEDFRRWALRAIPESSSFQAYTDANPDLVHCKDTILTEAVVFARLSLDLPPAVIAP